MSNKDEGLTVRNHLLHERSRLFEKYAAKMSLTIDNVEIKLDYPDEESKDGSLITLR